MRPTSVRVDELLVVEVKNPKSVTDVRSASVAESPASSEDQSVNDVKPANAEESAAISEERSPLENVNEVGTDVTPPPREVGGL